LIEAGKVFVDGAPVKSASDLLAPDASLTTELDHPYVSRGGLKLEGALADLSVDVRALVIADIGASTGGFTDCVLQRGAERVYAIDVGHDQLHAKLRADSRVIAQEGVNARELTALPEAIDLVVVDASFISLTKLLPALVPLLNVRGRLLALVKPQFEVGPANLGKRGVVSDDALRERALQDVVAAAHQLGLRFVASADSRVEGPEGNREIFALFER
jgi:23S rRNA (cytidine1920-2'-O)/16S rRNA (cytidine1409-2'-O)-methyltransferase